MPFRGVYAGVLLSSKGMNHGISKGLSQGISQANKATAIKMLKVHKSYEEIS